MQPDDTGKKKRGRLHNAKWEDVNLSTIDRNIEDTLVEYRYRPTTALRSFESWKAYKMFLRECPAALEENGGQKLPIKQETMRRFIYMV